MRPAAAGRTGRVAAGGRRPARVDEGSGVRADGADRRRVPLAFRRHRMVAPVSLALTRRALFLDVDNLARAADITIAADHAPARQCREPEKPHHAHGLYLRTQGVVRTTASSMPQRSTLIRPRTSYGTC